jgi:hypothetical protein
MILCRLSVACILAPWLASAGAADEAEDLLAKADQAFRSNQERQEHWNWNTHETRRLLDKSGKVVQTFPSVDAESILRKGGKRCHAVLAWGDGKTPYLVDADPETRCQAMESIRDPFPLETLLRSTKVKVQSRSGSGITLAISPDKSRLKDSDFGIRCAASIQATLRLDPNTFFPVSFEGEVVESGCNMQSAPVTQYAAVPAGPATSIFRKSARFRLEFALQKDKFQNPANSAWFCTRQEFDQPWNSGAQYLYYWGRQLAVRNPWAGHRIVKEVQTTAREFGAETQLRFDK